MQLHDQLSVLTLQNPAVLDDPHALRAALAPYVAGDPTATDEAELLVALAAQGVTRRLVGAIDGGADPAATVGDLGDRLAAGVGAPATTVRWAVAALGYAAGRVSDAEVRRHLLHDAPTQAPSSTPPPVSPPTAYGAPPQPAPAYAQPAPAYGTPPAPTFPSPGPTRKSRAGLVIAGVVAAVVVIAGGVTLVLTSGGDDDPTTASDDTSTSVGESPTSSEPTSDTPTTSDEPTTEITEVEPTVTQAASDAFVDALNAFSPQFTKASNLMTDGRINHEFDKTLAGARMMRDAVYDLDAATRQIDLSAIQEAVNEMLTQDAEMIRLLDRIQNTTNSRKAVRHVAELPITDFTDAFQKVAVEIDSHVA